MNREGKIKGGSETEMKEIEETRKESSSQTEELRYREKKERRLIAKKRKEVKLR